MGKTLMARGASIRFAIAPPPRVPSFVKLPEPIRVATGLPAAIEREGFEVVRAPVSLRALYHAAQTARARGYDELRHAVTMFSVDALATARVLIDESRRRPFDVVVADFSFVGAGLAAEVLGVPYVSIFHSGLPFRIEGAPPFGSGLSADSDPAALKEAQRRLEEIEVMGLRKLNEARRALGLSRAERGGFTTPHATGLNVLTTFEALEVWRPSDACVPAGPLLWAGPCLGDRSAQAPAFPWERVTPDARLVYISLGTVFNDQPALFADLIAAVHRAGARAVVAAGASVDALGRAAGADDIVVRFAPQLELLPRVAAMIGHGGNNGTNEALRAGCPLVVVPFGAEQIANGARVEALGVGASLPPGRRDAQGLDRALSKALSEPVRARARALAASLPEGDGAPRVADAIEALLARRG